MRGQARAIFRIIDANINRAKEGLRVCEEITRFLLNSPLFTSGLKKIRHRIDFLALRLAAKKDLMAGRRALSDVGKRIYANELKRENLKAVFFANIQRAKESVRVLEEFSKLRDKRVALNFKKIRYDLYELEKKILRKIYQAV